MGEKTAEHDAQQAAMHGIILATKLIIAVASDKIKIARKKCARANPKQVQIACISITMKIHGEIGTNKRQSEKTDSTIRQTIVSDALERARDRRPAGIAFCACVYSSLIELCNQPVCVSRLVRACVRGALPSALQFIEQVWMCRQRRS